MALLAATGVAPIIGPPLLTIRGQQLGNSVERSLPRGVRVLAVDGVANHHPYGRILDAFPHDAVKLPRGDSVGYLGYEDLGAEPMELRLEHVEASPGIWSFSESIWSLRGC